MGSKFTKNCKNIYMGAFWCINIGEHYSHCVPLSNNTTRTLAPRPSKGPRTKLIS